MLNGGPESLRRLILMLEMNAVDLIRLNIEIEHTIGSNEDLVPISGKESALFSISRYQDGYVTYFRYDIPAEIREQIAALGPDLAGKVALITGGRRALGARWPWYRWWI